MGVNEYSNYSNTFIGVTFSDFKYKVALQWPTERWNATGTQTITNNPPFQDDVIPTTSTPSGSSYASANTSRSRPSPVIASSVTTISKELVNDLRKNAKALEAAFNFAATDPTYSDAENTDLVLIDSQQLNTTDGNPTPAGNGLLDGIEKVLGIELTGVSGSEKVTKTILETAAQRLEARAAYNNYSNHSNYGNSAAPHNTNGYVNTGYAMPAPSYTNYYVNHANSGGYSQGYANGWWCCHRNHTNYGNHSNNGGNTSTGYLNYIVHYVNYSNANGPGGSVNAAYVNNG